MLRLPQELLQQITQSLFICEERQDDRLYSDAEAACKDDLLACSRVCRALRVAATPYLFRTISFYINADHDETTREDVGCRCRSLSGFKRFVATYPTASENVQQLRVSSGCDLHMHGLVLVDVSELSTLCRSLPRLQAVRLSSLLPDTSAPAVRGSIPTTTSLQALQLLDFAYRSEDDEIRAESLVELLCSFPSIDKVKLLNVAFRPESPSQPLWRGVSSLVEVHCLEATACTNVDNFLSLLGDAAAENLSMRSLALPGSYEYAHITRFGDFLHSISSGLNDLFLPLRVFQLMNHQPCKHKPPLSGISLSFKTLQMTQSILWLNVSAWNTCSSNSTFGLANLQRCCNQSWLHCTSVRSHVSKR